ncbi:hypothetical protein WICPIJ_000912 [Wickerhamomyces pijperi]|uniref:Serine hydrolase domain-containing protein n=1 Tax=Wickerhamomyces pijperi TaxID=599730 RepID=A0A9P8TR61_WICPI|nr:hypothetical protein WICPIJ_000912 [Wickerhamomyces pijperi]
MAKKILFLHGYAQSASMYKVKTRALRILLENAGYETIYLQGPVHIPCEIDCDGDESIDLYAWCPRIKTDEDVNISVEDFKERAREHHGDVEGIIAFSQGACLSGIIAAQYKEYLPNLKWIIFCSGFGLNPREYGYHYKNEIDVPSLHVLGELDTVINSESSMRLYGACNEQNRTLWTHHGGHFFPHNNSFLHKVTEWIQSARSQAEDTNDLAAVPTLKLH